MEWRVSLVMMFCFGYVLLCFPCLPFFFPDLVQWCCGLKTWPLSRELSIYVARWCKTKVLVLETIVEKGCNTCGSFLLKITGVLLFA